jgi:plasmid rolling circle replication initiator protein Rep
MEGNLYSVSDENAGLDAVRKIFNDFEEIKEYRQKTLALTNFLRRDVNVFGREIELMTHCGTNLKFSYDVDNKSSELAYANFCRTRICPQCQKRRSLKLFSNTLKLLEDVKDNYKYIHLCLTIPSVGAHEMRSEITRLYVASRNFFKETKQFCGVIRSLEVSLNCDTGMYHPHLHCLVLVRPSYFTSRSYLTHEELQKKWGKHIFISNPQVYIRKCENVVKGLIEVVKYASKPIDDVGMTDENKLKFYEDVRDMLKSRRLIQLFGVCAEINKKKRIDFEDESVDEDMTNKEVVRFGDLKRDGVYVFEDCEPEKKESEALRRYNNERIRKGLVAKAKKHLNSVDTLNNHLLYWDRLERRKAR